MAMNLCHRVFCSSGRHFESVEDGLLPWALADVDLGDNVLEIGPGSGGVFAGSDSAASIPFRLLHFRDICNPVSPQTLPDRFCKAGFHYVHVDGNARRLRWRAVKVS
jgi:hypothetical protein